MSIKKHTSIRPQPLGCCRIQSPISEYLVMISLDPRMKVVPNLSWGPVRLLSQGCSSANTLETPEGGLCQARSHRAARRCSEIFGAARPCSGLFGAAQSCSKLLGAIYLCYSTNLLTTICVYMYVYLLSIKSYCVNTHLCPVSCSCCTVKPLDNHCTVKSFPMKNKKIKKCRSCSELLGASRSCSELLGTARCCLQLLGAARSCSELLGAAHKGESVLCPSRH